jgi:hypothetical protein
MTTTSNQKDFHEKCAFLRRCKRLSPDIVKTAAKQEVLYVFIMFELWVLKELEWPITPVEPDSTIAIERKYKVFFIL